MNVQLRRGQDPIVVDEVGVVGSEEAGAEEFPGPLTVDVTISG